MTGVSAADCNHESQAWSAQFLRRGTQDLEQCCHLISRTAMLVANSWSRALRLGSLCKPTHKRRFRELCLSGALQILDLIDWLIQTMIYPALCSLGGGGWLLTLNGLILRSQPSSVVLGYLAPTARSYLQCDPWTVVTCKTKDMQNAVKSNSVLFYM